MGIVGGNESVTRGRGRDSRVAIAVLLAGAAFARQASAAPTQSLITGEIDSITLNNPADVWSGGKIVVTGQTVILPRNLLMDLPANRLTLQQLFAGAPPACLALHQSGIAKADSCNASGAGGIATIAANTTAAGDVIAGDVFLQKGAELVNGVVTFLDLTNGYFRVSGTPGSAATGLMVRINDPTGRHTLQQGAGCAGSPNCSPDARFGVDPDNYTAAFASGYPLCIPSTVARTFTDVLDFNLNHNTAETLTAQSTAAGAGDLLCPDFNRPANLIAGDSRRLAPILVGDHVMLQGNFETVGGTRFLSAWRVRVSAALSTSSAAGQPDYMLLDSMFIDAPGFQVGRIRDEFIGYATAPNPDVILWSMHRDPVANAGHEFLLGTVTGCDTAAGAGTCSTALGPNSWRIRHDTPFGGGGGGGNSLKLSACAHLNADPRFAPLHICPLGGTSAEEFGILSPIPHEVLGRTGLKYADLHRAGGPILRTLDFRGHDATNGEFLFPMGVGLGGIELPTFVEININLIGTPLDFSGIPWNLDRRLSPNGCVGPCETTPQPLDPFPFERLDPRTQTTLPTGVYSDPNFTASTLSSTSNRILSFVDGAIGKFNGDRTVLAWPPTDPGPQGLVATPNVAIGACTSAATAAPTLTSVTPLRGKQGSSLVVTLIGTNFAPGAQCTFGAGIVSACNVTSATSATALLAIDLTAVAGTRNVVIKNPDGQLATLTAGFTVDSGAPVLTTVSPTHAAQAMSLAISLTGQNFQTGAQCAFGAGITAACQVTSATTATGLLSIATDAAAGARDVVFTNPNGLASTLTGAFTVDSSAPSLLSVSPATAPAGSSAVVALTGTNFSVGAQCSFGAGIVSACTTTSATTATAVLAIDPTALLGPRDVVITNASGRSATLPASFLVTASGVAALPTATLTASAAAINAGSPVTLTFSTTNATSVTIDPLGSFGASGQVTTSPLGTTTYLLTATGPGGVATSSVTVTVRVGPTATLTGSPTAILPGGSATLTIATTLATSVSLTPTVAGVPLNGTVTVRPTVTTTYTLTATGTGGSAAATATITVLPALPTPGASVFSDNFPTAFPTSMGPNWTLNGNFVTIVGETRGTSAGGTAIAHTAPLTDMTVSVRQLLNGTASGSGVIARATAGSYYAARLLSTNHVQIIRVDGAGTTVLADVPVTAPGAGFAAIQLQVFGSTFVQLQASYKGAVVATVVDDSAGRLLSGGGGLLSGSVVRTQYSVFNLRAP